MATRRGFPLEVLNPKYRIVGGSFTIGGSGAVSGQDGAKLAGAVVTKTGGETGRYTVTFDRSYKRVVAVLGATMFGPTDAAFPTTTGSTPKCRNKAVTSFDIQFIREDTQADADPASGTVVDWAAVTARA